MEPRDEQELERAIGRLLSGRARLSRTEHESIAASVLKATAAEPIEAPSKTRRWWPVGLMVAAAAALALVVLLPREPDPAEPDPFVARGVSDGPQLQLECQPSCRRGAHVTLEVAEVAEYSHVAVFSFRGDGAAIWYSPGDASGQSAPLAADPRSLLPFRIEIDETHPAGRYDVVAVFSKAPLNRDALRSAYRDRSKTVAIVERVLVVEASP